MSNNLRILHVIRVPRYSGAEMLVRDLGAAHAAAGHRVGVCGLAPAEDSFAAEVESLKAEGVWWRAPARRLGKLGRLAHVRGCVREFQPDVVVAHSVLPAAQARLALLDGGPAVVTVLHDGSRDDYGGLRHLRVLERMLRPRTDAVVGVADRAVANYARRIGGGPRLRVIQNGIRVATFRSAEARREEIRRRLGISPQTTLILQVGRIARVKRQHCTLQAVGRILGRRDDVALWFAGLPEEPDYLDGLRGSRAGGPPVGGTERVRFLGPRGDVPDLLAAADVYVMPSAAEGHSVAMLESLASGVTVIASNIAAFSFAARYPGVTLVDPENLSAYASAVDRAVDRTVAAAPRWARDVSEFSVEVTAASYLSLFHEAIAARRHRPPGRLGPKS